MKKRTNQYKLLLTAALLLATTTWLFAMGEPEVEKKKTYSKSYPVSASEKISINNQFGEVRIVTWDKAEVKVDITILVKANTEERAQEIIDNITIEDGKGSNGVFFKTNMKNHNLSNRNDTEDRKDRKDRKNNSTNMEINYEVHMPSGNPLDLLNSFGKSYVPDLKGPVDITQKFGDLEAGNLSNVKDLHVEFGSATVESISNCKVIIKFSKAEIKKMHGAIKCTIEFSDHIKLSLDNDVTEFNLNNSYSTIEVKVAENFSGQFDIHTNFGEFHNKTALAITEEKEDEGDHGPKFDKTYSGKSGSGANKVKIRSSFGTVKFI